jgi:DNA mismatch endonuclease (patch repair protein)
MKNDLDIKIIKTPRFKASNGFVTTAQRSKIMSAITSQNTKAEILLRKALWKAGLRYRKNNRSLPGAPDISIKKYKLAIFVDGEFWHGFDWDNKKMKIRVNTDFWFPKIERNMQRDYFNNLKLGKLGYKVFRFWEKQVKKDLSSCVNEVLLHIEKYDSTFGDQQVN